MVFREVRRVLRKDGTVWLNLGDSYWNHSPVRTSSAAAFETTFTGGLISDGPASRRRANGHATLKMKDLVGIPWRVAFALQADGWWLRSAIVWAKPNPMPESVTDRPTSSYEHVFLLARSEKYYYDADAIREPNSGNSHGGSAPNQHKRWAINMASDMTTLGTDHAGRNKRNVWTITTKPFPEAHFATFPEDLVVPCVLAGSPVGGTVLDPFAGAGTVGVVCSKLGRDCIGIELNPEYAAMATRRISGAPMSLFA